MNKLNNKGFTLVELIATVVILSLVITIGVVSITTIINKAKEKDYELLIKEIKNAVEEQYIECKFANNNDIKDKCPNKDENEFYQTTLQELVDYGFLKGNYTIEDPDINKTGKFTIVNPKNNHFIDTCKIKYQHKDGITTVVATNQNDTNSCPTSY